MKLSPSSPVFWGIVATLLVAVTAIAMALGDTCALSGHCEPRWTQFVNAPFNEVGDTLAGFAGAMAFIWIIVTVLLQSKELAAQREELSLTRKELKAQREASEEMAKASAAQTRILASEEANRISQNNDEVLRVQLEALRAQFLKTLESNGFFERLFGFGPPKPGLHASIAKKHFDKLNKTKLTSDEFFPYTSDQLAKNVEAETFHDEFVELSAQKHFQHLGKLIAETEATIELCNQCSPAMLIRLKSLELKSLAKNMKKVSSNIETELLGKENDNK